MKGTLKIISLLLIAAIFQVAGCTNLFGPSNEEVIKAINDSGLLKDGGFTITAPLKIVEKGKRAQDGSWPVKVKVTMNMVMPNGQTATRVTTPIFRIHKSKDSAGNTVWTATAGGGGMS